MGQPSTPYIEVTIANGGNLSGMAELHGATIAALILPTIDNAAITFQGSGDRINFKNVYDDQGNEVSIVASTGDRAVRAPAVVGSFKYIKVRTGTSGTPVNQTAARTIGIVLKDAA